MSLIKALELTPVQKKALILSIGKLSQAVRKLNISFPTQQVTHDGNALRENRTKDGVDVVDDGVLHDFSEYPESISLVDALEGVDWPAAVEKTNLQYWVCSLCNPPRSTSDEREEHLQTKHPLATEEEIAAHPSVTTTKDIVVEMATMAGKNKSSVMLFTIECPVYRLMNAASREFGRQPEDFFVWQKFARRLNDELLGMPAFTGIIYRAIDFKPPSSFFAVGSIITWNQPSSTSKSAKVVRDFLSVEESDEPFGTIYTIVSKTGRAIEDYSVLPWKRKC
jgi:hypothetical protein